MVYITFGEGSRDFVIIAGMSLGGIRGLGMSVAAAYKAFCENYTVCLFDRVDDLPEGYTTEDMAADIAGAMDQLGIRNADILGVSQGGMIAQLLSANRPELVRSLVLCSTMARGNERSAEVLSKWLCLARACDIPALNRCFYEKIYTPAFCRQHAGALKILENMGTPEQCRRFVILGEAVKKFDSTACLDRITCPVLVIGDEDDMVLGAEASRELAAILGCESYFYRGYGHAVYDTAPDIKQRMLTFFEKASTDCN